MFSVFDRRTFSARGVTQGGKQVRIGLNFSGRGVERRFGRGMRSKLKALPDERELQRYARQLLHATFIKAGDREGRALDRLRRPDMAAYVLKEPAADWSEIYRPGDPNDPTAVKLKSITIESWLLKIDLPNSSLSFYSDREPITVEAPQ